MRHHRLPPSIKSPLSALPDAPVAQSETREALKIQNRRFAAALRHMPQGLALIDAGSRVVFANAQFAALFGLDAEAAVQGRTLSEIAGAACDPAARQNLRRAAAVLAAAPQPGVTSARVTFADGRVVSMSRRPAEDGGAVATFADISARMRSEERADFLARHDALTGLPNRITLHRELERLCAELGGGGRLAVISLDLDRFRSVNDTLGHAAGDLVLKAVGERLAGVVRGADMVARSGGDEFAVLQRDPASRGETAALARRIIAAVQEPLWIDGRAVNVGVSAGIAVAPGDAVDFDRLLKMADIALRRAKSAPGGDHRFFDPEMDAREDARRALEFDLRQALGKGELFLVYQPIVGAQTGEPVGFEALLRWRHPERGVVPPAEFIPLAESLGLIVPIGAWVVKAACAEAVNWPAPVSVAVNISPLQISAGGLGLSVLAALAASGLSPRRLGLEITETTLLDKSPATLATLHELRGLGISISMDDYGTGYSSLSSLRSFPFDRIKIDQSFVRELTGTDQNSLIVQSICSLAAGLGMTTVAEGVETEQQMLLLRAAGCTLMQGYLFGRPMAAEDARALAASRQPHASRSAA